MSEPFIAEIKIFGGNFAPRGYAFCDGQILPISQNTALFSLVGTTYGGDGRSTFGLPDLRGHGTMHPGRGPGLTPRRLGEKLGSETVTLTEAQLPNHSHSFNATPAPAGEVGPTATNYAARTGGQNAIYSTSAPDVDLSAQAVGTAGGGQAHANLQPALVLNFIIALQGLYPSRS